MLACGSTREQLPSFTALVAAMAEARRKQSINLGFPLCRTLNFIAETRSHPLPSPYPLNPDQSRSGSRALLCATVLEPTSPKHLGPAFSLTRDISPMMKPCPLSCISHFCTMCVTYGRCARVSHSTHGIQFSPSTFM